MKKLAIIFLAILITSCSTAITQPEQEVIDTIANTQPEQEAVDTMISIYNGGNGSEKGWDKQKITDFVELQLSDADTANDIQQRVCINLSFIEKNDQDIWVDRSISYALEKKDGKWREDSWLQEQMAEPFSPESLDSLAKIVSGSCDWAREFYGISD